MTFTPPHGPSRRSQVPPFTVMTVLGAVAEARSQGRDVLSLCAGEPGQGAPTPVIEAATRLLTERTPLGYTETRGLRSLREAIAGHYRRWYDLNVDPDRICLTNGSSGGVVLAGLAAFEHGDRVALARPGYPAYANILSSLGVEVIDLDCGPDVRYQPTVDQLDAAHAFAPLAGVILASPANPTGTMIGAGQLAEVLAWCHDRGVRVISDEIYHGITFTGSVGTCAWQLDESAIVVNSFSKYWGMTGWRLGWLLLPEDLVDAVDALAGNLALCAPVPAQYAALEAFTETSYAECDTAVAGFAAARQVVLEAVPRLGWTDVAPTDGAFYVYAGIEPALGRHPDSVAWCRALLDTHDVALTPGVDFDGALGAGTVRLSLAPGARLVDEAIRRILTFQAVQ